MATPWGLGNITDNHLDFYDYRELRLDYLHFSSDAGDHVNAPRFDEDRILRRAVIIEEGKYESEEYETIDSPLPERYEKKEYATVDSPLPENQPDEETDIVCSI